MFDIKLEGARKVVTVHSALIVENKLSLPVELVAKITNEETICVLPANEVFYIPVNLIRARLYARPVRPNWAFQLCEQEIKWAGAVSVQETSTVNCCRTDCVTTPYYRLVSKYCNAVEKTIRELHFWKIPTSGKFQHSFNDCSILP